MYRSSPSHGRHLLFATGASLLTALVALATPASAHVEATATPVGPGGAATVEFSFHHGCDGSPTTGLKIQIPATVGDLSPQNPPGWTSQVSVSPGAGGTLEWTGGSVPDGTAATFRVTMAVSAPAGSVLVFPTIQKCAGGENTWIAVPVPGQSEPENVAPSITVERPAGNPPATPSTPGPPTTVTTTPTSTELAAPESDSSDHTTIVVVVIVLALFGGGGLILYIRGRSSQE